MRAVYCLLAFMLCSQNSLANETAGSVLRVALPAFAWGATKYLDDQQGEEQFYWSFASTVASTYAIKSLVDKERPDGSGNDAFPSGHAAMAFQGAAFVQKRYGWKYGAAAYGLATYVGWTRVDSDKHDVSDVVVGALLGIASVQYFVTENPHYSIRPRFHQDSVGLQIAGRW